MASTNTEAEEQEFEVEVHIRQLQPEDDQVTKRIICESILISTLNRMFLNTMERPFVLCFIGLVAILVNWLTGALFISLFTSVICLPLAMYIFVRFVWLPFFKYKYLKDVTNGMYKYWSEADSGRSMWVAECNDMVIGCVAIETVSPLVAKLERLCVEVEWQCMGVGGRLAEHAMDHVKQRQFKEVITESFSVNPEASNLFNKMGFIKTGTKKVLLGTSFVDSFSWKLRSGSRASLTDYNL